MSESETIMRLIGYWVDFTKKRSDQSLEAFAKWLPNQLDTRETDNIGDLQEKKMQLGRVFGRLMNFTEIWGKLAFKELPIKQFEDFGVLSEVAYRTNPSKNEIANLLLNEKSTAFEIIKRLIRDRLLEEHVDEEDKRIRRIRLTKLGSEVLEKARIQAGKVVEILLGDSSEQDIDFMLGKFIELDQFHSAHYEKGGYKTIDDLLK